MEDNEKEKRKINTISDLKKNQVLFDKKMNYLVLVTDINLKTRLISYNILIKDKENTFVDTGETDVEKLSMFIKTKWEIING